MYCLYLILQLSIQARSEDCCSTYLYIALGRGYSRPGLDRPKVPRSVKQSVKSAYSKAIPARLAAAPEEHSVKSTAGSSLVSGLQAIGQLHHEQNGMSKVGHDRLGGIS